MKRAKWIVDSKFTTRKEEVEIYIEDGGNLEDLDVETFVDDFNDIEISVVREDNKHGQKSYGWGGDEKIILFDEFNHDVTQKDMDWYQKVAETVCNALNCERL